MAKKEKALTYRGAWDEILAEMPWQQRQKILQAGEKYRKPADLAEIERLYYKALGLSEDEIKRRMGMTQDLKIHPEHYQAIPDKGVEIRTNDRDFKVGEMLNLREFVPAGTSFQIPGTSQMIAGPAYTGRVTRAKINHILKLEDVPGLGSIMTQAKAKQSIEEDRVHPFPGYVALSVTFPDLVVDGQVSDFRELAGLSHNVRVVAVMMETLLASHAKKGPATEIKLTGGQCMENLRQQVHELDQAMIDFALGKIGTDMVLIKVANVGNYAMFGAQVVGALKAKG